jgi:hypothetical protein
MESVKEGEYSRNRIYENRRIKTVGIVLRRGNQDEGKR